MGRDYLLQKVNYYFPDWRQRVQEFRSAVAQRGRDFRLSFSRLVILFGVTGGVYAIVLIYTKSFWFTFQDTPVGEIFLRDHASSVLLDIFAMLEGNLFALSYGVCADVLVTGICVGLLSQLLALRRYFYHGRGIVGHIVWSVVIAILASFDVGGYYSFSFSVGIALFIIPSLCLHDRCLKLTSYLLPEFLVVFKLKQLAKIKKEADIRNVAR